MIDALYFANPADTEPLSAEEERAVALRARDGDQAARDLLVISSVRWVAVMIQRYENLGVEDEDLMSEGIIGLCRAADRFDPTRGFRFFSYATHWVRQALVAAVREKGRTVRVPSPVFRRQHKVNRERRRLEAALGRPVFEDEVAEALDVAEADVFDSFAATVPALSLDSPAIGGEFNAPAHLELLTYDGADPRETADDFDRTRQVERLLEVFDERSRDFVARYYGLAPYTVPQNLREIAEVYDISRERVRQICARVLSRIAEDESLRPAVQRLEAVL